MQPLPDRGFLIQEPDFPYVGFRTRLLRLIAFDRRGRLLSLQTAHSYDIIHGRHDWDDDNFESAAAREAYEQAGVIMGKMKVAAVLVWPAPRPDEETYELVMTGRVRKDGPMPIASETPRQFLDPDDFLARYGSGDPDAMKSLIRLALQGLSPLKG